MNLIFLVTKFDTSNSFIFRNVFYFVRKNLLSFYGDHRQILRCQPPHHKGGRSRPGGAHGQSEARGGRNQFKVHTNPQGWLPPAALTGCGGRGSGIAIHISFIIYFNCCRQQTNTTSIPHSGTAGYPFIHQAPQKRLPAPTPQRRMEQIETGTRQE